MALLKNEKERQEYLRLKAIEEKRTPTLPAYKFEPVKPKGNEFDPFTTQWVIDGERCEVELRPHGGISNEKIDGFFPSLYGVSRGNTFFGWLQFVDGAWKWFSDDHDPVLAVELGWWVVVGWYG